ncbi:MAG: phosphatidylglycerophosphatase A [Alphaproteobacteria bacterium]
MSSRNLKDPIVLICTFGGSGLLKPAPGTWGTLAALPFAWWVSTSLGPEALILLALVYFVAGLWAADLYEKKFNTHDAGEIVIDEAVGVTLALAFVPPSLAAFAIGFLLFRLFDILKPWPVSYADKSVDGALGVMLDDVIAGVMAAAVLAIIHFRFLVDWQ